MTSLRKALRKSQPGWRVECVAGARDHVVRIGPCENPSGYIEPINHKFKPRYNFKASLDRVERVARSAGVGLRMVGEQNLDGPIVRFYDVV